MCHRVLVRGVDDWYFVEWLLCGYQDGGVGDGRDSGNCRL